ncbi:MAG: aminodeoxychorismate/anthranilate synthase component II [Lachnospiraceae bacterium]|nr:aminodeoxychorismate/anthranilate synthase component II [Lachnospiraceae bacterium]MBR1523417.1 aminodeoxychorismate/anthranilate synthase component II [Lachnospiraceae bacterium]
MIVLIDNYDSFSYNLYQLIGGFEKDIRVVRNDEYTVSGIRDMKPAAIILSPGPGKPKDAGICEDIVRELKGEIPILGVCLGHQAICEAYGATVTYAGELMHGKQSEISCTPDSVLFKGLPEKIKAGRYHSLAVDPKTLPDTLKVTATAADGEVMAVEDRERGVFGLQFHPESIMTPDGETMIRNFLSGGLDRI